jgi:hypothetical protein
MTAPQAQQPCEWVEKAMALAQDYGVARWATGVAEAEDSLVNADTAEARAVKKIAALRAALTQREAAFAAVVEALDSIVKGVRGGGCVARQPDSDGYYSEPIHRDEMDRAESALALARAGEGKA